MTYATENGTAWAGSDYNGRSNTLTINAGAIMKTISITVRGDLIAEPTESFFVNLTGATNATIADGRGECTTYDND